jgi:hypothetical protein
MDILIKIFEQGTLFDGIVGRRWSTVHEWHTFRSVGWRNRGLPKAVWKVFGRPLVRRLCPKRLRIIVECQILQGSREFETMCFLDKVNAFLNPHCLLGVAIHFHGLSLLSLKDD